MDLSNVDPESLLGFAVDHELSQKAFYEYVDWHKANKALAKKALRVLMGAHLYYDRDIAVVPDVIYDGWAREMTAAFDSLPLRLRFAFGDPKVDTTGMGFRLSHMMINAAVGYYIHKTDDTSLLRRQYDMKDSAIYPYHVVGS